MNSSKQLGNYSAYFLLNKIFWPQNLPRTTKDLILYTYGHKFSETFGFSFSSDKQIHTLIYLAKYRIFFNPGLSPKTPVLLFGPELIQFWTGNSEKHRVQLMCYFSKNHFSANYTPLQITQVKFSFKMFRSDLTILLESNIQCNAVHPAINHLSYIRCCEYYLIPSSLVGFNMRKISKGSVTIKLWDIGRWSQS